MQERWRRLERWVEQNAPARESTLRPPATEQELDDAEATLGVTLPPSVRRSYLVHDGEKRTRWGVLGARLLPLEEVVQKAQTLREIGADFDYDFWGEDLIPLFAVGNGDYRCVLDTPENRETPLLEWDHEQSSRDELDPSFAAHLDTVLAGYEAGQYSYDDQNGRLRPTLTYD